MSKNSLGLLKQSGLGPRQIIGFAILSAVINGMVTAAVGAWLAQSYASYQKKTAAVQSLSDLVYERRTRAGMVMWAIRRNGELDELRFRKRAYDEAFVAWNKKVQYNIFMIRDISGEKGVTKLETQFQEMLVPALSDLDSCLTKAYDVRIAGGDGKPLLEACRMTELYQFTLDCAATFTNELDRLTRFSFLPLSGPGKDLLKATEARIDRGCTRPPAPASVPGAAPAAAIAAPAAPEPLPPAELVLPPAQPALGPEPGK